MFVNSITLALTNDCNMACAYCFEGRKNRLVMSADMAGRAVDWLLDETVSGHGGHVDVTFFGGEPLLEADTIRETVAYARERAAACGKEISFSVTTNGTLFTEELASFCREEGFGMVLSCDGVREAHDTMRRTASGEGSFPLVERNFPKVLSLDRGKEVRMTISPRTVPWLAEGVRYLKEQGFESIAVFHVEETTWTRDDLIALEKGFYEVGELLVNAIESGESLTVNPLDSLIRQKRGGSSEGAESHTCGAGRGYVGIAVDGTIYPCHRFVSHDSFTGAFAIGNIDTGFDEAKRMPFLRMKKKLLMGCDIECDACTLYGRCTGGCLAANYAVTGQLAQRPPTARMHELIWDGVAGAIVDYFRAHECAAFEARYAQQINANLAILHRRSPHAAAAGAGGGAMTAESRDGCGVERRET